MIFENASSVYINNKEVESIITNNGGVIYEKQSADVYSLALNSNKSALILDNEESATITATLTCNNVPVSGETIVFEGIGGIIEESITSNTIYNQNIGSEYEVYCENSNGYVVIGDEDGYKLEISNSQVYVRDEEFYATETRLYCNEYVRIVDNRVYCGDSDVYIDVSEFDINISNLYSAVRTSSTFTFKITSDSIKRITDNNGQASITYVPTTVGEDTIIAKYDLLEKSVTITTIQSYYENLEISTNKSILTYPNNETTTIVATLKDVFNNPLSNETIIFEGIPTSLSDETTSDKIYDVDYEGINYIIKYTGDGALYIGESDGYRLKLRSSGVGVVESNGYAAYGTGISSLNVSDSENLGIRIEGNRIYDIGSDNYIDVSEFDINTSHIYEVKCWSGTYSYDISSTSVQKITNNNGQASCTYYSGNYGDVEITAKHEDLSDSLIIENCFKVFGDNPSSTINYSLPPVVYEIDFEIDNQNGLAYIRLGGDMNNYMIIGLGHEGLGIYIQENGVEPYSNYTNNGDDSVIPIKFIAMGVRSYLYVGENKLIIENVNQFLATLLGSMNSSNSVNNLRIKYPLHCTELIVSSDKSNISTNDTDEIYGSLVDDGVVESNRKIYFYEKANPSLDLYGSSFIMQKDESNELYVKVEDDDDGSLLTNTKVHFYQLE